MWRSYFTCSAREFRIIARCCDSLWKAAVLLHTISTLLPINLPATHFSFFLSLVQTRFNIFVISTSIPARPTVYPQYLISQNNNRSLYIMSISFNLLGSCIQCNSKIRIANFIYNFKLIKLHFSCNFSIKILLMFLGKNIQLKVLYLNSEALIYCN